MASAYTFETKRLRVQAWSASSLPSIGTLEFREEYSPLLTPTVLKHLPEALQLSDSENAIERWLEERVAESDLLTVRDSKGILIGLLILAQLPEQETLATVHVGYLFSEAAWGRGYATELIAGLIDWYRDTRTSVLIIGGVEKGNAASARVLQKNGFERMKDYSDPETDMFSKRITEHS